MSRLQSDIDLTRKVMAKGRVELWKTEEGRCVAKDCEDDQLIQMRRWDSLGYSFHATRCRFHLARYLSDIGLLSVPKYTEHSGTLYRKVKSR